MTQKHVPVSVAICDNLTNDPSYIVSDNPQSLVRDFVKELERRQELIADRVGDMYPLPDDKEYLPVKTQNMWKEWVNQVSVFGFNSGKYDINLIKEYFVKNLTDNKTKLM